MKTIERVEAERAIERLEGLATDLFMAKSGIDEAAREIQYQLKYLKRYLEQVK